ncbi:MAG: hypothetical protein GWN00_06440 [Aliifodinibius sp.]|nr:hypothetical protein [candidate division KSB1 bacterium]NIT55870.1 hypothetical protein [Fodinibius sp.]NIV10861.1 hypothetical protein [Fodinibius sp.]NIY24454.1 hypothetical protein [Fodinibius sp.]
MIFNKREQKISSTLSRSLNYTLLLFSGAWLILLISLPADIATAQKVGQTSEGVTSFSIKISSISPAAGVSYGMSNNSELRLLGFVTTYSNLSPHDNQLFLDLSYLRYTNWVNSKTLNAYWGLNVNMLFEDSLIGPGLLLGSSYQLSSKFAIFAEVGLNAFIDGNGSSTIGLHNSGVGIKIGL